MCSTQHIRETLQHEVTHKNDDRYIGRANEEGQNSCRQTRDHLKQLFTRLLEKEVGELLEKAQKARKIKEMAEQLRTGDKKLDAEIESMTEKMWKRLEG